jgi:hypothetical protein
MACALTALNSTTGCPDNEGGVQYSYVAKLEDITGITVTSEIISAITMSTTGLWKKLQYDKDSTAYFNQVGERINDTGPLRYNAEALLKFGGFSSSYKTFADGMGDCCKLVFIHVMTNGALVIQGLEIDAGATGGFTGTKSADTKATPTMSGDTANAEARLEVLVRGRSKKLAPFTDLTPTEIEAL